MNIMFRAYYKIAIAVVAGLGLAVGAVYAKREDLSKFDAESVGRVNTAASLVARFAKDSVQLEILRDTLRRAIHVAYRDLRLANILIKHGSRQPALFRLASILDKADVCRREDFLALVNEWEVERVLARAAELVADVTIDVPLLRLRAFFPVDLQDDSETGDGSLGTSDEVRSLEDLKRYKPHVAHLRVDTSMSGYERVWAVSQHGVATVVDEGRPGDVGDDPLLEGTDEDSVLARSLLLAALRTGGSLRTTERYEFLVRRFVARSLVESGDNRSFSLTVSGRRVARQCAQLPTPRTRAKAAASVLDVEVLYRDVA